MNRLLQGFANMPAGTKAAVVGLLLLAVVGVVLIFGGTLAIYVVLAGLAIIGLLLGLYQGVLSMQARRHAEPMRKALSSNAAMAPTRITEPARRARLDDLRKNFEGGVEKFKAAGKNLYAVPWYLLVGEPGSGKTEAIRHCNVGFPPGLQDQLQGVGGTLNMNWWFTNHAVVLDTAGRLLFDEVEPGTTSEWHEFLKLLRRNRPNCPVNGMLLVIPAESLIKDSADAIEQKAGRIAQQLDGIQRDLGVRFPVFVLITKCDLINGFREFFDEITDPALQHQILGWSNPDTLDTPFNPELVEEHLRTVQQRLARRRAGLLLDPINTENPRQPRTDQVDALYAFPDAVMKIAPRLKRYLEMIFVSGEWAQKPLFLRGIYFTSSMREGSALDQELAEAFGVPVESLPEGRVWERDRAYFLRDLFVNKVFKEKGLVTRAVSTRQQQQTRYATVIGVAAAGLLAVGLVTWIGARGLAGSIVKPAEFWSKASEVYAANAVPSAYGRSDQLLPIVSKAVEASPDFKYRGGPGDDATPVASIPAPPDRRTRAGMAIELRDQALKPIEVPLIFRPVATLIGEDTKSLSRTQRLDAARTLFEGSIVRPLVDACRINLRADAARGGALPPEAAPAIEQLTHLERACAAAPAPAGSGARHPLLNLEALMRYALRGNKDFTEKGAKSDVAALEDVYRSLYTEETWPPASIQQVAAYRDLVPDGLRTAVASTTPVQRADPAPPIQPQQGSTTPKPTTPATQPATPPTTTTALKFPLAPYSGADAELMQSDLDSARAAAQALSGPNATKTKAMLATLPTASHPAQICTISILADEPPSLGKSGLGPAATFVAIVPEGSTTSAPQPLGRGEIKLARLRAPGPTFELRFFASDQPGAAPVATLKVPSHWGGLYLVDHFKGQPARTDDRHTWDAEADLTVNGSPRSIWLRLEFDAELPELPWF